MRKVDGSTSWRRGRCGGGLWKSSSSSYSSRTIGAGIVAGAEEAEGIVAEGMRDEG